MSVQVSTLCAGSGYQDGKVEDAKFQAPVDIAASRDGKLYFSDYFNYRIRMISDGMVSTIAGCGQKGYKDGKAEDAKFSGTQGICISHDNRIYVSELHSNCIRMISDGTVSTFAGNGKHGYKDGKAEEALFFRPSAMCITDGGILYVFDAYNHCIRMVSDGLVSTFAGCNERGFKDGKALEARFHYPAAICVSFDDKLYLSDTYNDRIRMIAGGIVSTIAGSGKQGFRDGKVTEAMFNRPHGICISSKGKIYVSDHWNCRIRMISDGVVSTIAGNGEKAYRDGIAAEASFTAPQKLSISDDDTVLYVTDHRNEHNDSIRMISGLPSSSTGYFELSSLLQSKTISDMILTINNQEYHLHTALIHAICPMIVKHTSTIEDAKISHESLQTMFEMIYSNNTIKIRKSKPDQYQMKDLTHLVELIWLFESFEIRNRSFVPTCIKQFKTQMKYLMKPQQHKSTIETLKHESTHKIDELIALSQLHGLQTAKLIEINQPQNQQETISNTENNNEIIYISMHDLFLFFGSHTEPRVVDQQQIKSETFGAHLETNPIPDYTIMTHDRSYSIKCHKLILYGKWSYFRRMIESGLLESASGEMIMSEDWNATRLYDFVKYLYT